MPVTKKKTPVTKKAAPASKTKTPAAKKKPAAAARPARPGGIGDEAVKKATGRDWPAWLKALDAAGCRVMSHREIVTVVRDTYGQGLWWQQMITVGYEQARGLREKHQTASGYTVNVSKTIGAPAQALFDAWFDVKRRRRWLADPAIDISTVRPPKKLRAAWVDGESRLDVQFAAKGEDRAAVTVSHEKLPDARAVRRMKTYWGAALAELKALLEA